MEVLSRPMGFPSGSVVKNLPAMQETRVWLQGQKDPLEESKATHSSMPAWENPMDRGAWWPTVHRVAQSRTWLKWHSVHIQFWSSDEQNHCLQQLFCHRKGAVISTHDRVTGNSTWGFVHVHNECNAKFQLEVSANNSILFFSHPSSWMP